MNSSEETFDDDPFSFQGLKRKRISSPSRPTKPSQAAATPNTRAKKSKAVTPGASQSKVTIPRSRLSKPNTLRSQPRSSPSNNNVNRKVGEKPKPRQFVNRAIGAVMPGYEVKKSLRKPIPFKALRKESPSDQGMHNSNVFIISKHYII